MARKLRVQVQYPGAIYHVMNRGDVTDFFGIVVSADLVSWDYAVVGWIAIGFWSPIAAL